jgi:ribosomal protein L37AE/L43A
VVIAALAIGVYGMVRYQKILIEAERLGERATCPGCGVYARFKLISASSVQCRKCSHEWRLIQ